MVGLKVKARFKTNEVKYNLRTRQPSKGEAYMLSSFSQGQDCQIDREDRVWLVSLLVIMGVKRTAG